MKLTKFALTAALALAGAVFSMQPANAQTTVTYTDGDLFMGFHSATSSNEYLWDLGQFSLFNNHPVGFHMTLSPNVASDLVTVFGTNWATDSNVQWGVAGTHDFDSNNNIIANLYATKAEPIVGTRALPWSRQSTAAQTGTSSAIETLAFGGYFGQTSTANNLTAVIHPSSGTGVVSWASFQPGGSNTVGGSFSTFVPTVEAPSIPGSGTGITGTRLDLFEILPDNSGTNPPSKYLGTFSIDAFGNVNFDVLAAVPEPSTYALLVAGGVLALVAARKRKSSASV